MYIVNNIFNNYYRVIIEPLGPMGLYFPSILDLVILLLLSSCLETRLATTAAVLIGKAIDTAFKQGKGDAIYFPGSVGQFQ